MWKCRICLQHRLGVSFLLTACVFGSISSVYSQDIKSQEGTAKTSISLVDSIDPTRVSHVDYALQIDGNLITPSQSGTSEWNLKSSGTFSFHQRRFPCEEVGPRAIRAARDFRTAKTETTVGSERTTTVVLPQAAHTIFLYGGEPQLIQFNPDVRLTRPQLDLLQFPCDPGVASGLLPSRDLNSHDEKWNADSWVVPMLVGMDATVSQSASCQLESLSKTEAIIAFECEADGAVTGSSTKITLKGRLTFDRAGNYIRELKAIQTEKRQPGPFSPGLDVKATISWTQSLIEAKDPSAALVAGTMQVQIPDERQLLLTLSTPWRILMLHNRSWHIFHETPEMVMLRMINKGSLVAQCNIASAATTAPGDSTSEQEYLAEVQKALEERKGTVKMSKIHPDINGWRIHQVRAIGKANSTALIWDYFLCTAKTGEQISLVFSYAEQDEKTIAGSPEQMLGTLTLRSSRPKVALPR